jgi:hypothetical protein
VYGATTDGPFELDSVTYLENGTPSAARSAVVG